MNSLHSLVGLLEQRSLQVAVCEPEQRLHVTNPLSSLLAEEIVLKGGRYLTSYGDELGLRGQETATAERIARLLAVADQHQDTV